MALQPPLQIDYTHIPRGLSGPGPALLACNLHLSIAGTIAETARAKAAQVKADRMEQALARARERYESHPAWAKIAAISDKHDAAVAAATGKRLELQEAERLREAILAEDDLDAARIAQAEEAAIRLTAEAKALDRVAKAYADRMEPHKLALDAAERAAGEAARLDLTGCYAESQAVLAALVPALAEAIAVSAALADLVGTQATALAKLV